MENVGDRQWTHECGGCGTGDELWRMCYEQQTVEDVVQATNCGGCGTGDTLWRMCYEQQTVKDVVRVTNCGGCGMHCPQIKNGERTQDDAMGHEHLSM